MAEVVASSTAQDDTSQLILNPRDYTSSAVEPSMKEMQAVFVLDKLASYLERAFCSGDVDFPMHETGPLPERPEHLLEWSWRVRKAIYRSFILGAALANLYQEPIQKAHASKDAEIRELGASDLTLSANQISFLTQFTVYNLAATDKEEDSIFGTSARWLMQSILADTDARAHMASCFERGDGRAQCCGGLSECPIQLLDFDGSHSDGHLLVWELTQILWVHFHIEHWIDHRDELVPGNTSGNSVARVVVFGEFEAEDLVIPEDGTRWISGYLLPRDGSDILYSSPVISYAAEVFGQSGVPNITASDDTAPPLVLKWFSYAFRHFFGAEFMDGMSKEWAHSPVREFCRAITLFSHDGVRSRSFSRPNGDFLGELFDGTGILQRAEPHDDWVFEDGVEDGYYMF